MGCKRFLIFAILFLFGIILIGFVNATPTWVGAGTITNCASSSIAAGTPSYQAQLNCSKLYDNAFPDWVADLNAGVPGQWVWVDLGSVRKISGVDLFYQIWTTSSPYYVSNFGNYIVNIDISNDAVNWQNVISGWTINTYSGSAHVSGFNPNGGTSGSTTYGGSWGERTFSATNGRYVRVYFTGSSYAGDYYDALGEIEVLTDNVCTPEPVSTTCAGWECGSKTNNCGDLVSCGTCSGSTPFCNNGNCVQCTSASDCGTSGYIGNTFCQSGDNSHVYQNYTTYSCSSNICSNSINIQQVQTCNPNQICSGGACIDYHQCSSPNDTILKLSYTYNGHGALWNDTNYLFDVCYSEIFGQAYTGTNPHSCNGNNKVIGLSATTNAVGEVPTNNNYLINVCYGNLTCRVSDKGDNSDSFDGASLDTSKWIQKNVNNPAVTENGRLKTFGSVGGIASSASGITSSGKWELHGDFDIQIGYDATLLPISNYFPTVALTVTGTHDYVLYVDRNASGSYKEHSWSEQSVWNNVGMAAATKGQFRIKRVGSNITGYIGDGNSWTMTTSASGLDTNDMYITIQTYNNVIEGTNTQGNVAQAYFDNFTISGGNCSANEKTVVALSAFTNAAIANRSDLNFPINICCKVSSTPGCIPDCSGGRVCGNDGCGGSSCGTCGSGYSCNSTGQCVPGCTSVCNLNDKECDVTTNISKTCIAQGSCNVWGSNTNCLYGCNTTSNDCLPTPQECQGISSCNDYQDPQNCSNDECLVGGGNCNSGQIENICGLTTSGIMSDCKCFWNNMANKCQLNTSTNINVDNVYIKQTCTISLQEKSQCVEGQNSVTQQATPNWENLDDLVGKQKPGQPPGTVFTDTNDAESWANTYCTLSNCFSGTKQMVCDDNGVRLSFFNWINFLAAIAVIVIVYLIWFLYRK